jgi:two-component SAPR family response regulator
MELFMFKIMLVSHDKNFFSDFVISLSQNTDVEITSAESGEGALKKISSTAVDLVVTDEDLGDMSNIEFAGRLVKINPMINCALVSSLSPEAFHEASEGLGIMSQLSAHPGKREADGLMEKLRILIRNA